MPSPSEAPVGPRVALDLHSPVPATWVLVALLVGVHVLAAFVEWQHGFSPLLDGLLFERDTRFRVSVGGQHHSLVEAGQVWRLWTSTFLHVDGFHLLVNALSLLGLGRLLEPLVGARRFVVWFLLGGLAGSLASQAAGVVASDGASGGAFALLGAAAILGLELRPRFDADDRRLMGPVLWGFVGLNLILSVVVPSIDLVGHVGGLLCGVVCAGVFGVRQSRAASACEGLVFAVFVVACLAGYGWERWGIVALIRGGY